MMHYLYLIKCENFVKIGISNDVAKRLSAMQTDNPFHLKMMSCYWFEDAETIEWKLHRFFNPFHERREWFYLDNEKLLEFEKLCVSFGGIKSANIQIQENHIPYSIVLQGAKERRSQINEVMEGGKPKTVRVFTVDGISVMEKATPQEAK